MIGKFSLLTVTVTALALALGGLAGAGELSPPSTTEVQGEHGSRGGAHIKRASKGRK